MNIIDVGTIRNVKVVIPNSFFFGNYVYVKNVHICNNARIVFPLGFVQACLGGLKL